MKLFSAKNVLTMSDEAEIQIPKFVLGDSQAFEWVFNTYKVPIMSYICGMIKNTKMAEDLTQEVFFKAYRYKQSFQGKPGQFKAWLWTMARNTTIDELRKKNELSLDEIEERNEGASELFLIDNEQIGQEDLLIQQATTEQVRKILSKLPLKQQEALQLRIFSELSYEEISNIMKESVAQIKTLIHRGRKSIIESLSKEER